MQLDYNEYSCTRSEPRHDRLTIDLKHNELVG